MNTELRQQPTSEKGAEDPDEEVTKETKSGPAHDLTCQPAGNQADKQDDQQTFAGHIHCATSVLRFVRESAAIRAINIIIFLGNRSDIPGSDMRSRSPISSRIAVRLRRSI
jgi:hypothetical protein